MELLHNDIEMWKMIKHNDLCYSDDQLIKQHAEYLELWANNWSTRMGFEYKWDADEKRKHITHKEFKREKRHYKATHHPFLEHILPELWNGLKAIYG